MIDWQILPGERTELYSPVGLRPVDEMTGATPLGGVRVDLDVSDESGGWRTTGISPVITTSGVIIFPALERRSEVVGRPARRFRIRLTADFYQPLYRASSEGIEFDAFPFNDANPPQVIASQIQDAFLTPATNYPFQAHIPVLRGDVRDASGVRVADVLVMEGARERVLTDERGAFALPLRWAPKNGAVAINATDQRNNRAGAININVPADLRNNHTIVIT